MGSMAQVKRQGLAMNSQQHPRCCWGAQLSSAEKAGAADCYLLAALLAAAVNVWSAQAAEIYSAKARIPFYSPRSDAG